MITRSAADAALRIFILLGVCAGVVGCAAPRFDLGPVASRDSAPDGSNRLRALGPIVEQQSTVDGKRFLAVRPFYASTADLGRDRVLQEFLWPAGIRKDFKSDRFWRYLTAYGNDFDTADPQSRYRFVIFPLLFTGRDTAGDGYFALFPLGGTIHEYLRRDHMAFILFPLFGTSTVDDTRTASVLWPVFSKTEGDDVSRFRVFPFYGRSVSRDCWSKRFVCWPIWTSVRYEYPDAAGDGGFVLFPLFGRMQYKDQKTWMLIPPLFRWTEGEGEKRIFCPWPFFQYSKGDIDKLYFWPLWGRKSAPGVQTSFLLWPIVHRERIEQGAGIMKRLFIVPFVVSETSEVGESTPATESDEAAAVDIESRYFKLWPLFSWRREGDSKRFRMLELWPTRDLGPVERNFTPLWTLYSRVTVDEISEQELLWGMFRRRTEGAMRSSISLFPFIEGSRNRDGEGARSFSFLKGLFEYQREGLRKTIRMLYFLKVTP